MDVGKVIKSKLSMYSVYPVVAPQDTTGNYIVYQVISYLPTKAKSLNSADVATVQLSFLTSTYAEGVTMAKVARVILENSSGNIEGINVDSIRFEDSNDLFDLETRGFIMSNTYTIRLAGYVYSDWFLPSKDLLYQMYINLKAEGVGDFSNAWYWSSSEFNASSIWSYNFSDGDSGGVGKDESLDVCLRPVRSFTTVAGSYSLRSLAPAGGRICYISGTTFYEAAASDQSIMAWSNIIDKLVGTSTALTSGQANTTAIIAQAGHVNSAAKTCNDLTITA